MALQDDWNKATADAKKVLGSNANIPNGRMSDALKAMQDFHSVGRGFKSARDALDKSITEMQKAISKVQSALNEADKEVTAAKYHLDPKKPDDKKKIDQADVIFEKFFSQWTKLAGEHIKFLDDIEKHVDLMPVPRDSAS